MIFQLNCRLGTQIYQHILAIVFAVKEINGNPHILTNTTLGFNIYNNYFNPKLTYAATMEILATADRFIPNYKCDFGNNLIAVIGGPNSNYFLHIATILSKYKIVQVDLVHETGDTEEIFHNPLACYIQKDYCCRMLI